jgi:hypothetical protein
MQELLTLTTRTDSAAAAFIAASMLTFLFQGEKKRLSVAFAAGVQAALKVARQAEAIGPQPA